MTRRLLSEYKRKKGKIKERLRCFRSAWDKSDEKVFSELCFCICTPQSKAVHCDKAVTALEKSGILFRGNLRQLKSGLKTVRFYNNKARYIIEVRKLFAVNGTIRIKDRINVGSNREARDWLVRNVKGIGYKEASHFLRNIGFGRNMAILDVHILRNLKKCGVIKKVPAAISKKTYLGVEDRMREFSQKINIPLEELDLLFWSLETGFIFK